MKAFGYVRLSVMDEPDEDDPKQRQTTSPQRQWAAIRAWCRQHGATLVDTFEDLDRSAYRKGAKRPDFDRMMSRLDEVDVVVALRLDRLARSASGFHEMLERFEDAGVRFVTTDGTIDMTTAAGRAFVQITATFAELESGTLSERMRATAAYKQKRGQWIGRVPYGFRRNDSKAIEVDPETFPVLEQIARRYVGGESLRRIASDLGMLHTTLARMLRSNRVIDALPPGIGTALVEQLGERGRSGTRAKRSLLGGIARCGVCGAGMTVVGLRAGWAAYACRERQHVSISKPWLEAFVSGEVLDAIDRDRLIERIEKRRNRRPSTPVAKEIEGRLELLQRDFYESGKMSRDSFLRHRDGLFAKLEQARKAAAEDEAVDVPRELAENLVERWADLELHTQRRIVAAVAKAIVIAKATSHGRVSSDRVSVEWRV